MHRFILIQNLNNLQTLIKQKFRYSAVISLPSLSNSELFKPYFTSIGFSFVNNATPQYPDFLPIFNKNINIKYNYK